MSMRVDITPDRAIELLRLLATDDDFRKRVEENPAEALREYDIDVPDDVFPGDLELPPKEEIALILLWVQELDVTGKPHRRQHGHLILWLVVGAMPFVVGDGAR
jgi:hypothetical protein